MTPQIFTLCRYAAEHNGSLTIIDTFDRINALKFPWMENFFVAAKFKLDPAEDFPKEILFKIASLSKENEVIFETKNPFTCVDNTTIINFLAEFQGLIFNTSGDYSFCIYMDNKLVGNCNFTVTQVEKL